MESYKVSKPIISVYKVEGQLKQTDGTFKTEERVLTISQITTEVRVPSMEEFGKTNSVYVHDVGIAILNPGDKDGELGETIATGRAEKKPLLRFRLQSTRRLPKPLLEQQAQWVGNNVENNLDNYVSRFREATK